MLRMNRCGFYWNIYWHRSKNQRAWYKRHRYIIFYCFSVFTLFVAQTGWLCTKVSITHGCAVAPKAIQAISR